MALRFSCSFLLLPWEARNACRIEKLKMQKRLTGEKTQEKHETNDIWMKKNSSTGEPSTRDNHGWDWETSWTKSHLKLISSTTRVNALNDENLFLAHSVNERTHDFLTLHEIVFRPQRQKQQENPGLNTRRLQWKKGSSQLHVWNEESFCILLVSPTKHNTYVSPFNGVTEFSQVCLWTRETLERSKHFQEQKRVIPKINEPGMHSSVTADLVVKSLYYCTVQSSSRGTWKRRFCSQIFLWNLKNPLSWLNRRAWTFMNTHQDSKKSEDGILSTWLENDIFSLTPACILCISAFCGSKNFWERRCLSSTCDGILYSHS